MKHEMKRRFLAFTALQLAVAGAVIWLVSIAMKLFELALRRNDFGLFTKFAEKSKELQIIRNAEEKEKDKIQSFLQNAPCREYFTTAHDGVKLYAKAYLQPSYTRRWAVVVHGYSGDGEQMGLTAKNFYDAGFNVFLPDCRGHGKSGGKYIGMGWKDRLDIILWTNEIVQGDKRANISLYGLSMGAATVLMASGEKLPQNVKCIIEDCGYTSVSEEFCYHLKKMFRLPGFPLLNIAEIVCKMKAGYTFSEASALKQVRKCKVPVLFIHGELDEFVPTTMAYRLYRAARCKKELYIVPKAGHGVSANVGREAYWQKIYDFTDTYCG